MKPALTLLLLGLAAFARAEDDYGEAEAKQIEEAVQELDDANFADVVSLRLKTVSLDPTPLSDKQSELSRLKAALSDVQATRNLAEFGRAVVDAVRDEEAQIFAQLWHEKEHELDDALEEARETEGEIEQATTELERAERTIVSLVELAEAEVTELEKCQAGNREGADKLDGLRGELERLTGEESAMRAEHATLTEDAKRMVATIKGLQAEKAATANSARSIQGEAEHTWDIVLSRTPEGRQAYQELLEDYQARGGEASAVLLQQLLGSKTASKAATKQAAAVSSGSGSGARPGCCEPESTEAADAKTKVESSADAVLAALEKVHARTREVDDLLARHAELASSLEATEAEKREAEEQLAVALMALLEAGIELHNLRVLSAAVLNSVDADLAHMEEQLNSLRRHLEDVRGNLEAAAATANHVQGQISAARELHAECREVTELLRVQHEAAAREIVSLRDSNQNLRSEVDKVGSHAARLASMKMGLDSEVHRLRTEEAQAQADLDAARGALDSRLDKDGRKVLDSMRQQADEVAAGNPQEASTPEPAPSLEPGSPAYLLTRGVAGFIERGMGYPVPPKSALCAPSNVHAPVGPASCSGMDAAAVAANSFDHIASASSSGSSSAIEIGELIPILKEVARANGLVAKCTAKVPSFQLSLVIHTKHAIGSDNPMAEARNPAQREAARMLLLVSSIFGAGEGSVSIDKSHWVQVMTPAIQEKMDAAAAKAAKAAAATPPSLLQLQDGARGNLRH